MLEVKLLGQFEVRLNEEPVEFCSRPAELLLEDMRVPGWCM
jgi:hypothetical protein